MEQKLSQEQKLAIQELFNKKFDSEFYLNLEEMLENTFLPPKGSRTVLLKREIKKLKEIEAAARVLKGKLSKLDDFFLDSIDGHLGMEFGPSKTYEDILISNEPAVGFPPISSLEIAQMIAEEAELTAMDLAKNYGNSYFEWFLDGMVTAYPVGEKISVSTDSKFIKFIAIVLQEESLEKIYKLVLNSTWFKRHRNLR